MVQANKIVEANTNGARKVPVVQLRLKFSKSMRMSILRDTRRDHITSNRYSTL